MSAALTYFDFFSREEVEGVRLGSGDIWASAFGQGWEFVENFLWMMKSTLAGFRWSIVKRREGRQLAFTLVELLTVVAIFSILLATLIPVARRARASAHETECKSNLRQLHLAVTAYLQDHQNKFPVSYVANQSTWASDLLDGEYVPRRRVAVGDSRSEIFGCPAQRLAISHSGDKHWKLQRTYGFNYYVGRPGRNALSVRSPSQTLLLADGKREPASVSTPYNVQLIPGNFMPTPAHPDQNGRVNCLFVDGHVEGRLIGDTPDGIPEGSGGQGNPLAELRYKFWQGY